MNSIKIFDNPCFKDGRGSFQELWKKTTFPGLPEFKQDNLSISKNNVVRGMHFQTNKPQGKLVVVIRGSILDCAVNLKTHELTITDLSRDDSRCIYIPPDYAHGFWSQSDDTIVYYKCTEEYDPTDKSGFSALDRVSAVFMGVVCIVCVCECVCVCVYVCVCVVGVCMCDSCCVCMYVCMYVCLCMC